MASDFLSSIVLGFLALLIGAEFLVRGASRIAAFLAVSPLVIGLTVVAYGTSFPELFVSLESGLRGNSEIAVSNIVGSNIFNVLFILGICASILPLVVSSDMIRRDMPILVGSTLLCFLLARDGTLSGTDGMILLLAFIGYNIWLIRNARRESKFIKKEFADEFRPSDRSLGRLLLNIVFVLLGFAGLLGGAHFLIVGSVDLARYWGVSESVIGLTVVAVGTSLPELATSVIASLKGERDIAVGNVVGSNIFNILLILGVASLATKGGLTIGQDLRAFDLPMMLVVAITCVPVFSSGKLITRLDGWGFLVAYSGYIVYLIMKATNREEIIGLEDLGRDILFAFTLFIGFSSIVAARLSERRSVSRD